GYSKHPWTESAHDLLEGGLVSVAGEASQIKLRSLTVFLLQGFSNFRSDGGLCGSPPSCSAISVRPSWFGHHGSAIVFGHGSAGPSYFEFPDFFDRTSSLRVRACWRSCSSFAF